MLSMQEKEDRKLGIGGSDMPIIMGLSSYKSPYQLYLEKKGLLGGYEETPQQYWGNRLESIIRDEFALRNNVKVKTPGTICHPRYSFLRGNVDGFIPEQNAVLEIKCSNQFMAASWGESGSDVIPLAYLVQVAFYCAVTNADKAYIAVLIGGCDYREFCYQRDLELEEHVINAAIGFWECVQTDSPPSSQSMTDSRIKYPASELGQTILLTPEIKKHLDALHDLKRKQKNLNNDEEKMKVAIIEYMKGAEALVDELGKPLATYKSTKRGSRSFLLKGLSDE